MAGCLKVLLSSVNKQAAAVVDTVAEVKAAGAADNGQTAPTENTAKPPPFKDPNFMVTIYFLQRCIFILILLLFSLFLTTVLALNNYLAAFGDRWSSSR